MLPVQNIAEQGRLQGSLVLGLVVFGPAAGATLPDTHFL